MKNFTICLCTLICFFTAGLSAQYELLGTVPTAHANFTRLTGIAGDNQGNTFVAGNFKNSLTLGPFSFTTPATSYAFSSGFIAKVNASHNWVWAKNIKQLPGQHNQFGRVVINDLAIDNNGNSYITGWFNGSVSFDNITLTSAKSGSTYYNDIFVAKLNANGSFAWAKAIANKTGDDNAVSIAVDASNNVIIGGYYALKTVSCSGTNVFQNDVFVAKFNSAGTSMWQKRYATNLPPCATNEFGSYFSSANDVTLDAAGNIYVAGRYSGTMSFGNGAALSLTSVTGSSDIFTLKLNGAGATQWVKSYGSNSYDNGTAVMVDGSGNTYTGALYANSTGLIIKYNASGSILWTVNTFTIRNLIPHDGALLAANAYDGFRLYSFTDGSLISADLVEGNYFPLNPNYTGKFIIEDTEVAGSGYVIGMNATCGYVTLENLALSATCDECGTCSSTIDMMMVRTTESLPLQLVAQQTHEPTEGEAITLEVYPSPATDEVHIRVPKHDHGRVEILDQYGMRMMSIVLDSYREEIPLRLDERFRNGVYYVRMTDQDHTVLQQFVVAK